MRIRRRLVRRPGFPAIGMSRHGMKVLVAVIVLGVLFQMIWMVEKNLEPVLLTIANTKVKKIAQDAMLDGIRDVQRSLGGEMGRLMAVEKGEDGKITFVKIDPDLQAKIYERVTGRIMDKMIQLEQTRIEVTLGQILQNNLLAEYGPDIPIQIWPKGAPKVNLVPKMESQGINMVMVTLHLEVHTEMGMVVPFTEQSIPVDFRYPIAQAVVVGEVPDYYFYNDLGQIKQESVGTPHHPVPPVPSGKEAP
ncbi:sporulation protein YunB [Staphylospora marina]|uniref:sporulation protein YunB n=1 Tax=Staphylospora marina TaxID=2490858 RepID=UPI000F5B9AED|nr:sporulation protein YunB [Staphylospora marina]